MAYLDDNQVLTLSLSKIFCLYDGQSEAVEKMRNGCILCGKVGSGKSRTSLAYYLLQNDVKLDADGVTPPDTPIQDLYIITTAKKRDNHDWEKDMIPFLLSSPPTLYKHHVVIDSWNNLPKYKDIRDSFFIFDEQRVTGHGKWVKAFLKIAKRNKWILLSATPGDTWSDYIPVFIANGFFRNKTDFNTEHVVFSYYAGYPKIEKYLGTKKLERLRDELLVNIEVEYENKRHYTDIPCTYDRAKYLDVIHTRWDPYNNVPLDSAAVFCQCLRHITNADESREKAILELTEAIPRVIIFYSFNYELDILRKLAYTPGTVVTEWNGHVHEEIPDAERWVYLVQYSACEGWNCIQTDSIIFYSQQYSYKVFEQACGRIDRTNSPYHDLYYYVLKSNAPIDKAISRAMVVKKDFNARSFSKKIF